MMLTMDWYSDWTYRKRRPLSRASGAVSNYQTKLLVGESSGSGTCDFHCEGHCLSNFNDLRFTASDGTTLLAYCIISISGTTPNQVATIWLKCDSIGITDTTFYVYYGKAGASAYSAGADSFEFFCHFDAALDSADWNHWWNYGGSYSVASSILTMTGSPLQQQGWGCKHKYGTNYAFHAYAKTTSEAGMFPEKIVFCISDQTDSSSAGANGAYFIEDVSATKSYLTVKDSAGTSETRTEALTSYQELEIRRNSSTNVKFLIDGVLKKTISTNVPTANCGIGFYDASGDPVSVDWVFVRKYQEPEPAWSGSWSEELTNSLDVTQPEEISISDEMIGANYDSRISESASISDQMLPDHLVDSISETTSIIDEMLPYHLIDSVSESASISDEMYGNMLRGETSESGNINDNFGREYEVTRTTAETSNVNDTVGYIFQVNMTINDSLTMVDAAERSFPQTITDLIFIWDTIIHGWSVSIDESLVLTDTLSEVLGLMIDDWITLIDSQTNNWNGREIVNQTLNLYDVAEKWLIYSDTINESLGVTDATTYALTVSVLEYLGFTSLASAMKTMADSLSESIAFADAPSNAWQEIISETLQAVDTYSVITTFIGNISESLTLTDTNSLINRLGLSLSESLVLTETISSKGTLYSAVYDTIAMNVTVELAGEVYECYVLNTPKFMPSMYSGFDFNSYCVFENRAYGANDTGVYELTGTTDAGSTIHDGVILSKTDFGSRNQKKFRRAYLGISGTAPVMVFECEDGSRQVYNVDTNGKLVVSREQKSKEWKLSIADFDTLDVMKLIPVILSK